MKALIVEDELYTAQLLKELIEKDKDFSVNKILQTIEETVHFLSAYQDDIDLIFLDIQLADGYSFEIFKHIDVSIPVIFCTAYDEYTLQAIKNNGIDYILKPFKEQDIIQALTKYKTLVKNIQRRNFDHLKLTDQSESSYQKTFLTSYRGRSIIVKAEEVGLFSIEMETIYLYTMKGEKHPLFKKMEYLASVCNPKDFFRVNRQMLVNRNAILAFEPTSNRKLLIQLKDITTKEDIIVSRLKVSSFKAWLEQGE